jgi:hypothetical protein
MRPQVISKAEYGAASRVRTGEVEKNATPSPT